MEGHKSCPKGMYRSDTQAHFLWIFRYESPFTFPDCYRPLFFGDFFHSVLFSPSVLSEWRGSSWQLKSLIFEIGLLARSSNIWIINVFIFYIWYIFILKRQSINKYFSALSRSYKSWVYLLRKSYLTMYIVTKASSTYGVFFKAVIFLYDMTSRTPKYPQNNVPTDNEPSLWGYIILGGFVRFVFSTHCLQ